MFIELRRALPRETRWGVFTNLFSPDDRRALRAWYFALHAGPLHLDLAGRA